MKKNLMSYGTALTREEAKKITGGDNGEPCVPSEGACAERREQCGCGTACCEGLTCSADIDGSP